MTLLNGEIVTSFPKKGDEIWSRIESLLVSGAIRFSLVLRRKIILQPPGRFVVSSFTSFLGDFFPTFPESAGLGSCQMFVLFFLLGGRVEPP